MKQNESMSFQSTVIREMECLLNGAQQLVERKVLSGFSGLAISLQQRLIV